jgi:hypothetical protein
MGRLTKPCISGRSGTPVRTEAPPPPRFGDLTGGAHGQPAWQGWAKFRARLAVRA